MADVGLELRSVLPKTLVLSTNLYSRKHLGGEVRMEE